MTDAQIYRYATTLTEEQFLLSVTGIAEEYNSDNWDSANAAMRDLYRVCNKSMKEIRNSTGLTQGAFAELINSNKRTVEDWEYGKRNPTDTVKFLILEFLGLFKRSIPEMTESKEYAVKTFSVEINRNKLLELKGMSREETKHKLLQFALEDSDPETYGVYTDRKTADENCRNVMDVVRCSGNAGSYYIVTVSGVVEIYTVDEDGEFLDGSDYDWAGELTEEEYNSIQEYF